MASIFAVTAASDSVRLDAQGRGRVTFTVTNTGSETLRARARAVPAAGTDASWLTVSEPAERRMPADGVEQYTVEVAVPAGTPAGRHSFRLDVDAEENPDEIFTQGPSVAFEVAPSEKPKKPFPWWILIVVAGLLVVGGVVALLLSGGPPGLNEECEDECAAGLACTDGICLGEAGFPGCTGDSDCLGELVCRTEEGTEEGVCAGPLGFSPCEEDTDCGTDLVCDGGTCLGGPGFAGCTDIFGQCAEGLMCSGGTCEPDTTGQLCDRGRPCGPGQSCITVGTDTTCLRDTGQPCTSQFQCTSFLCRDGRCTTLPDGAACTSSLQCTSKNCEDGRCRPRVATGCGVSGRPCPLGTICIAGRCQSIVLQPHELQNFQREMAPLRERSETFRRAQPVRPPGNP